MTKMYDCKMCQRGVTFLSDMVCGSCRRKLLKDKPVKSDEVKR